MIQIVAAVLALGISFSASAHLSISSKEGMRPATGSFAEPVSALILNNNSRYLVRVAKNPEVAKHFVEVWLSELKLILPDTLEFISSADPSDDFTYTAIQHGELGDVQVASKGDRHQEYLSSGVLTAPLSLLGLVDDETAADIHKQVVEHLKVSHEGFIKLNAIRRQQGLKDYFAEFTSVYLSWALAQPSQWSGDMEGFKEELYVSRSLAIFKEASKKGYINSRLVFHATGEVLGLMKRLEKQNLTPLHRVYNSQEISHKIRELSLLAGANRDFVDYTYTAMIGVSCETALAEASAARN